MAKNLKFGKLVLAIINKYGMQVLKILSGCVLILTAIKVWSLGHSNLVLVLMIVFKEISEGEGFFLPFFAKPI